MGSMNTFTQSYIWCGRTLLHFLFQPNYGMVVLYTRSANFFTSKSVRTRKSTEEETERFESEWQLARPGWFHFKVRT